MKTSKEFLQTAKCNNNEESQKKAIANKLGKSILIIFMLFWITLMTSCAVSFGIPFHEGHGGGYGHHGFHAGRR